MAFLDTAETRTYAMLQQALRNHMTLHTLSFPHTLGTCGALFALLCAQLDDPDDDPDTEVTHLLTALKHETRARQTLPPLAAFPAAFPPQATLGHLATSEAVFAALAQLYHESLEAERVTRAGAVRIVLSLLAESLRDAPPSVCPHGRRRRDADRPAASATPGADHGLSPPPGSRLGTPPALTPALAGGQREPARTELAAAVDLYRAMDMTFWLPETEAALAQVKEG